MEKAAKIYLIIISILLLMLGVMSLVAPTDEMFVMKFGIIPDPAHTAHGLNSLRGFFAGAILSFGIMILLGYKTLNRTWFDAVTLMMILVVFGRIIALIVDGYDPLSIAGLVGEAITIPVLLYAANILKKPNHL